MNTSSQTPSTGYDFGRYATLGEQATALEALNLLVSMFPTLPPAYFTMHATSYSGVHAQCATASDFEAWRTALQIPTDTVDLYGGSAEGWLAAETSVRGVHLRLTGFGLDITPEQAEPQGHGMPVVTLSEAVALMGALPMPAGGAA